MALSRVVGLPLSESPAVIRGVEVDTIPYLKLKLTHTLTYT